MNSMKDALERMMGPETRSRVGEFTKDKKSLVAGAAAGGLLAMILSGGKPGKLIGRSVKMGGLALAGGLAYKAWQDWQAGKAVPQDAQAASESPALPAPEGTAFAPADPLLAEALSAKLVRTMVAAARADGHLSEDELATIRAEIPRLGLGREAEALIVEELGQTPDARRIGAMASSPEEAAEIYAAALLVTGEPDLSEKVWLSNLSVSLGLEEGLKQHLEANARALG